MANFKAFVAVFTVWCGLLHVGVADETRAQRDYFEEQVRPLLAKRCFKCHGPTRQEGGLRLDSAATARAGGDSGAAIVPGDLRESLIIEAIHFRSLEMPPDGKLPDHEVEILTRWVQMGAPWPDHPQTTSREISAEDKSFWAFQPLSDSSPPVLTEDSWSRSEIDRFVYRKLRSEDLAPAAEADRLTLIRRACFDLIGLPPSLEQVAEFLNDDSSNAYEALIDRLLENPHYGEKWARHWLDLVRYAESHGHGSDQFREDAFRYRDYVVEAFNRDLPYDRFVTEQLAGDEVSPGNPDALTATGFLRHWIYESNQRKVRLTREIILNDVTEVTGEVFLGMGMSCARCHDHKFDPIPRRDYYRLQAFFAPLLARDDLPLLSSTQLAHRASIRERWEAQTADIRQQITQLEQPIRQAAIDRAIRMLPQEIKEIYRKPRAENTPLELQLVALVEWQLRDDQKNPSRKMDGVVKEKWQTLHDQLAKYDANRPVPIPLAMAVTDIGRIAPPTIIPGDAHGTPVEPGFLSALDSGPARIEPLPASLNSTGRRSALARWITSPSNPLATRVIVNRIWQYHFGRGLVGTPSDFGRLGERPSHPDLLDWLARRFVADGWSFKKMHRLIMTSATYRQASRRKTPQAARRKDPSNRWLWRMPIRRLDAEQIRDSMLAVSGELDYRISGPSVDSTVPRRTIYTKVIRNTPDPLLRAFDAPDGFGSTATRDVTTTAAQALMMINGDWTFSRAQKWAADLLADKSANQRAAVETAFQQVTGKTPNPRLLGRAMLFVEQQTERIQSSDATVTDEVAQHRALADLCHVVLNSNEFLYVD